MKKLAIKTLFHTIKDSTLRHIHSSLREGVTFSSERYQTAYPDVRINPLKHYKRTGRKEGRFCYTVSDMGDLLEYPTDNKPLISVVMTSYNYERYLVEAIESVLAQTYSNKEIIIVDDGSSDSSVCIIEKYAKEYDFIHFYTHADGKNHGLVASMKLGIEKARGEYVAFCESDDYWAPQHLSKKVEIINHYSNVAIISNGIKMFGNEADIEERGWVVNHIRKLLKQGGTPIDLRYNQEFNFIPTLSSVMIRRDLLLDLDFNTPVSAWIDFWLYRQILLKYKLYFVDEELTYWRQHNSLNGMKKSSKIYNQLPDFLAKSNKLIGL